MYFVLKHSGESGKSSEHIDECMNDVNGVHVYFIANLLRFIWTSKTELTKFSSQMHLLRQKTSTWQNLHAYRETYRLLTFQFSCCRGGGSGVKRQPARRRPPSPTHKIFKLNALHCKDWSHIPMRQDWCRTASARSPHCHDLVVGSSSVKFSRHHKC